MGEEAGFWGAAFWEGAMVGGYSWGFCDANWVAWIEILWEYRGGKGKKGNVGDAGSFGGWI